MPENEEVQATTPVEQVEAQQPASEVPETGSEQTAEQIEQPKPKNDWVQRRIDQLTREKHEERRQREDMERRLRDYESRGNESQPAQPVDIDAAVEAKLRQRDFDAACNKVFDAGKTEFPDWQDSLRTFQMLGGANPQFLEAITSMDNGHRVLHALGQDPETAERVLSLPPLRMALELARMETTQAKTPPVSSKAPPPINPVGGRSAPVEPEEFATAAEQIAYWKKHGSKG